MQKAARPLGRFHFVRGHQEALQHPRAASAAHPASAANFSLAACHGHGLGSTRWLVVRQLNAEIQLYPNRQGITRNAQSLPSENSGELPRWSKSG
jgi:hypothetical protein